MRTESEVIDNVLELAEQDNEVRAVIRTDLLPIREYPYYNFYFIVNDMKKYEDDSLYETSLGERILLYRGDINYPEILKGAKAHLMVFKDGVTIVIKAITLEMFMERYNVSEKGDTFRKLLDKEKILPDIDNNDGSNLICLDKPSENEFNGTCMEYFWVLKTFAEYIMRRELPAAMFYLNISVRDMLDRIIRWHIAFKYDYSVSCGILNSYFGKYLEEDMYHLYENTYPTSEYDSIWNAYDNVVKLFHEVGKSVASDFGYTYPERTEQAMLEFIDQMKNKNF